MPFVLGLRMDAAMTAYWMIMTGLLFTASSFLTNRLVTIIQGGFTILFLTLSSLLVVADLELYKHWGFRMNSTPLMYLGSEAAGSVSWIVMIGLLLIFAVLFVSFLQIYQKRLKKNGRLFG